MGADVTYRVRVAVLADEWIEVQAVTAQEAQEQAERLPHVEGAE